MHSFIWVLKLPTYRKSLTPTFLPEFTNDSQFFPVDCSILPLSPSPSLRKVLLDSGECVCLVPGTAGISIWQAVLLLLLGFFVCLFGEEQ